MGEALFYQVAKEFPRFGKGRWVIRRVFDDNGLSFAIGTYESRKAATVAASLLAGWRGTVKVVGR